jgi:hypothetical protein
VNNDDADEALVLAFSGILEGGRQGFGVRGVVRSGASANEDHEVTNITEFHSRTRGWSVEYGEDQRSIDSVARQTTKW